jgi:hypothetical protein
MKFHITINGKAACECADPVSDALAAHYEATGDLHRMPCCGAPDYVSALLERECAKSLLPCATVVVVEGECPTSARERAYDAAQAN